MSAKDLQNRANDIIKKYLGGNKVEIKWNSVPEAKQHLLTIRQLKAELTAVKKEAALEMKAIRADHAGDKAQVGRGAGAQIGKALFGAKAVGSMNAAKRDQIRREQMADLTPYENLTQSIDGILLKLDQIKLQIDSWLLNNK